MALTCRACDAPLTEKFVDLGAQPLANSYLSEEELLEPETYYPLVVYTCSDCLLVQLPEHVGPERIFSDYLYFSSYAPSWVEHAKRLTEDLRRRFDLGMHSLVAEVASNDGYLLQHLKGRTCILGIEPAENVAKVAREKGVETEVAFFGYDTAKKLLRRMKPADVIIGINVFAHVPNVRDFIEGLELFLAPRGVIVLEFPHLRELIRNEEFDTIYHEHYSYYSLRVAESLLAMYGLEVFDVETLPTHGGSLRLFVGHRGAHERLESVDKVLVAELEAGLDTLAGHRGFQRAADGVKRRLLGWLLEQRVLGKSVAGFGAPAKGNTLLNYAGVKPDLLPFTVDDNPHKQGRYLPGSRIPIRHPDELDGVEAVLVLPWNLRDSVATRVANLSGTMNIVSAAMKWH